MHRGSRVSDRQGVAELATGTGVAEVATGTSDGQGVADLVTTNEMTNQQWK